MRYNVHGCMHKYERKRRLEKENSPARRHATGAAVTRASHRDCAAAKPYSGFGFQKRFAEGVAIVVVQMVTQHVGDCKIITVVCAAANARHSIKNEMETKKAACLNACASCHVCASARVDAVARWPTALFICNKRRRTSRRRSTYSPQS